MYQVPVAASVWQGKDPGSQHPCSQITSGHLSHFQGWGGHVWFPGLGDPQLVSCSENGPKLSRSMLLFEPRLTVRPSLTRGFLPVRRHQHPCEPWVAVPGCLWLPEAISDQSSPSRREEWVLGRPSC